MHYYPFSGGSEGKTRQEDALALASLFHSRGACGQANKIYERYIGGPAVEPFSESPDEQRRKLQLWRSRMRTTQLKEAGTSPDSLG